jgi:S-methylmethionine-dependent homocysteine/selenocysteine methylase
MLLSAQLARKPLVMLDGAMGTELHRHGVDLSLPLWSANALIRAPHLVRNIHFWYLHAGADVITANTFRTNIRALDAAGLGARWEELNLKAVEFAFEARERYRAARPVTVAASIAPVEDCYCPHLAPSDAALEDEHGRQAELLALMGAELLLAETMNSAREAAAAARACAATGREFAVSFVCDAEGALLSGEPLRDAVDAVRPHGPVAMLVNCVSARDMHVPLALLLETAAMPAGCYANVGPPLADGMRMRHDVASGAHADAAARWAAMGARIIGGCCGTTPELLAHIAGRLAPLPPDLIAAGIHRHAPLPPELAAALAAHHASTPAEGDPAA